MKKWKLMLLGLPMILSSCGNIQVFDTTYRFDYMHVFATNTCYKIKSWKDYEDGEQLQVTLDVNGTESTVLVSSTGVALIKGDCPFRHEV